MMNRYILTFGFLLAAICARAQLTASATSDSGSGYLAIQNAGLGIENPDCEHTDFGPHITQLYDADLDRNVFAFHSHIDADNDRCLVFDRVRMEIKGGPNTDAEAQHVQGETSYYRWKFRLDEDFVGVSSFCHLFQNKARGGADDGFPVLTITARTNRIELMHNGGDTGSDLGVVAEADLSNFLGRWVEAYVMQVSSETGALEVTLTDMETGQTLLAYTNESVDLWRTGAEYNRPKWGVYRAKADVLQDEIVRFADFCISETSEDLCPAEAVLIPDTTPPTAPTNLMADNEMISTVDLNWEPATDDFGVVDYLVLQNGLEVMVTPDLTATVMNLTGGTTYDFAVQARDAAGNVSVSSNIVSVTTDPANTLPDNPSNPFPSDAATEVNTATFLSWTEGSNTDSFRVRFGPTLDPPVVSTQTSTSYSPDLEANTTYYWQIIALNSNGETAGPIWSFSTGDASSDFPWRVYRADARMEEETSFWELESIPPSPMTDGVTIDPIVSTNNFYSYRYDGDEKFRWRTDLSEEDSTITIVARLKPFSDDVNGMCHFEVRAGGWRQKVRLNDGNIKLEATTPVIERDLNFDWDDKMHVFRMVVKGSQTTIYLDEDPNPFLTGTSDEATSTTYFDWGKGGGSDYGSTIDWLAFDLSGDYPPGEGTPLPQDLILSNDATLASLSLDGIALAEFSPDVLDYFVMLLNPDLPQLSWVTSSPFATAEAMSPSHPDGDQASITVFAQDGVSQRTYTLNYSLSDVVDELGEEDLISIFPNPSRGDLQISLAGEQRGIGTVFNANGLTVRQDLVLQGQTRWDFSTLPAGVYLLRVQSDDNQMRVCTFVIH